MDINIDRVVYINTARYISVNCIRYICINFINDPNSMCNRNYASVL